ncbi:MAG: hypothetical protein JWL73_3371, partial [Actinomycetia bacterium]|nr:hypothetical protein [Actinomycetes bacterium]
MNAKSRRASDLAHGEGGVTLVLALVFVLVIGVFIVALVALTGTTFRAARTTRAQADLQYSADGGADYALEKVRTTTACPPTLPAVPALNGVTPTLSVTCTGGTAASTSVIGSYAAIALGAGGISVGGSTQNGDNLAIRILGNVYSAGSIGAISGTGNSVTVQGNAELSSATCAFLSTTNPAVTGTCTGSKAVPTVAATSPNVIVPAAAAPAAQTSGTCTILYPGVYTTAPTFVTGQGYYLASGTYYFNGTGDINIAGGWIQGGATGGATAALSSGFTTRCPTAYANDTNAKTLNSAYTYTGSGVTLILGGNAVFRMQDNADTRVELYARTPAIGSPDLAATAGVSIWGQTSSSGVTGTYNVITQAPLYTNGKTADFVNHGLTWLPNSAVQLAALPNSDAGGAGQLMGGVV